MRVALPFLAVAAAFVCACHGGDRDADGDADGDADSDSATLRRAAMYEWYNDHPPTTRSQYWTPEYMRYVNGVAADERARWGNLIPKLGVSQLVTGSQWVNIGPTRATVEVNGATSLNVSDSGRTRTIINTGTRLYVATAAGGVWRSDNDGATWTAITESLGSLSIGSLAIDPVNASVLYLGLGDPYDGTGIGFVRSTDGGDTWSAPVYLGASSIIPQVFVQGGVVLAATNKGLFRSVDGGATFSLINIATGGTEAPYIWSIQSTGAQSLVLALEGAPSVTTGTTDGQVWVSSNNGATWTRAAGVTKTGGIGRITLASAPSNRSIVYAMAAVPNSTASTDMADIFKSTDGGATWTALNATTKRYTNRNSESSTVGTLLNAQGWYNGVVIVNPTNPNDVWFGGALLICESTDGGSTFTEKSNWLAQFGLPYVHADFHTATFANGSFYVGTDGGVFVSTNNGTTWSDRLNVGLTTHLFYSVGSSPAAPTAVVGGLQDNGTRVRSGTTSTFNQYIGGDGFGAHMNQTNAAQMLGSLYYDQIYKSTDSGVTWSNASTGITESNNSTTAPFITRINPRAQTNELYTFSNFKVYKSTNYAASWAVAGTPVTNTGLIRNVGVAWDNANFIGVVGSGGRVWLSSNGGTTWTQVASGKDDGMTPTALPGNQLSLSDIRFDPADATHNTIFVASVAPDAGSTHLWKTTNFGTTWAKVDVNNGLPPAIPINFTKEDPMAPATIFAGTHLGVYRSTDGGATWSRFGAGMPLVNVDDMYISPDGSLVRAASYGRGIWDLTAPPVNHPPVLSPIGAKSVNHGATLAFQLMATDQDGDPLTFSATGLPTGATISPAGAFSYTAVCNDLGAKQVTFKVSDNHGGSATEVVTITVNGGRVAVTPTTLDYGSLLVGNTATLTTSASSTGTLPITFSSATTTDPAFTIPAPPSGPITTGTPIGVKFTPTASMDYSATLTVNVSDGTTCTPSVTAALTGRARTASVDSSPMNKDFGDVRTDRVNAYPTQVFTVTNMGTGSLAVSDVTLNDATNYALDKGGFTSPTTLAAGGSATFTITARPQTIGAHAAMVTVMSNAPGDTAHVISLAENGVRPLFTVTPPSIDFGTTASPVSQNITLTNTGNGDLTFGTATLTGASASAFSTSTLPATLAPGATMDLVVTYTPAGADTASLAITSDADSTNACGSLACATTSIALTGTADNTGSGSGSGSANGSGSGGGGGSDGGDGGTAATGGCCDAGGGGFGGSAFLSLSVLGVVRRRRRR
ncbi:MAG: choice-of-anchor D domain-containing protein [Deltaproteobacteria bacterium]|nr:choice-of-anchor D domain-containing protein [Deltaproteobacteria bacterium]